ncbi:hypothetical protein BDZ89DRAFT_1155894 [Hymenopellis radicata]|nr:hypothetical protein BDZ89DRAFT_1155894 [Hymenopellis radicata]
MPAITSTPSKPVRYRPERTVKTRRKRRKIILQSKEPTSVAHGNTKGLPTLPVELHLEILLYLPSVPIPCPSSRILPSEYRDRFDAIFALSQTCSALYHVYHPLLWKSIEVCAVRRRPSATRMLAKKMATELVFQAEVVTVRAPHLAEFVQVFNVALTTFSSLTVYKEFVRCLQCLPNLHTLQIISFPDRSEGKGFDKSMNSLRCAFAQAWLRSVETLTLPFELLSPMRVDTSFPNLRHIAILHRREYGVRYTNKDVLRLIPRSIYSLCGDPVMLDLLRQSTQRKSGYEFFVEQFPHLRITPKVCFQYFRPGPHSKDIGAYIKLLRASLRNWAHRCPELHTFQLLESNDAVDLISMDAVVDIAKDVLSDHLKAHENIVEGRINVWRDYPPPLCPYRVVLVRRPSPD